VEKKESSNETIYISDSRDSRERDLLEAFHRRYGPVLSEGEWETSAKHSPDCPRTSSLGACACDEETVLTRLDTGRRIVLRWRNRR
jgi:hypothetical protein